MRAILVGVGTDRTPDQAKEFRDQLKTQFPGVMWGVISANCGLVEFDYNPQPADWPPPWGPPSEERAA